MASPSTARGNDPEVDALIASARGGEERALGTFFEGVGSINSSHAHLAVVAERTVHAEI